jgi:hypothetical protein
MLKFNSNLTSLSLNGNNLTGNGWEFQACEILSEWVSKAANLTSLDLAHTRLGDAGCVRIARGLAYHSCLQVRAPLTKWLPAQDWHPRSTWLHSQFPQSLITESVCRIWI